MRSCFPLYLYEKDEPRPGELLREESEGELIDGYRRRHAITDGMRKKWMNSSTLFQLQMRVDFPPLPACPENKFK